MMFFFLKSCLSFILLCQSLPLKLLPPWMSEMRLVSVWLWKKLSILSASWLTESGFMCVICEIPTSMPLKKKGLNLRIENVEEDMEMSILDLPELALESILGRLSPSELCTVASVCSSLRDRCRSDHLWKRHMKAKWGRVVGPASYREWQWHLSTRKELGLLKGTMKKDLVRSISCIWPFYRIPSKLDSGSKPKTSLPVDSLMALYLSLESGKFWFPAQVYNREHGHVGFMLSCYDAVLSYDSHTDTFHARYPPHGKRALVPEEGVQWDRLRAPLVDTPPHDLHVSDCLNDLCPGDNIEIQWRRNEEIPYGWWYGVVGHLESCDGNENQCHCHNSDTVLLEFNQYTPGSRWRRTAINRKDHREGGNDADGFYGGIRKLYNKEEISMWKRLWPTEVLE